MKGKLYIVATPIGNLKDITFRAIETLKSVAFVLAEDTRETQKLFREYDINTSLVSYRDQNHDRMIEKILEKLDMGLDLALVSDSGTPCISDPGFKLVRQLRSLKYDIIPVPGPSAVIAALSVSGLNTDKFTFLGFLPKGDSKREQLLKEYSQIDSTLVIYESPNRVKELINQIVKVMGDRKVCVANDITKLYERFEVGSSVDFQKEFPMPEKGEFVILIEKE